MRATVKHLDRGDIEGLISHAIDCKLFDDERNFHLCMTRSSGLWGGMIDGQLVCLWGLVPPSLMSNSAYLWLYTLETMQGHEFLFVRYSQRVIEHMLQLFPTITGAVSKNNPKAQRWLKWLGAEFEFSAGEMIPFEIRKPADV